ncbi:SDR family oxidoreductase [Ruficoccus sp. ZRK36]|uniref:SDR family NAD(P)-dependent oxidoreductase n=1 Tax=Ruficoccus sp. ZRK36 TaxID=2866311 RepID=UPI001C737C3A|nr:SDR family oxidoreductase [Ruficoccus sp. ZRK36]QYY35519.1 SDR family oxidoreductase [Ruficoccus sp. ZRK36]
MDTSSLFDLSGRTALVTGSSRGIGHAIALTLARAGANVAIHATSSCDKAKAAAAEVEKFGVKSAVVMEDLGADGAPGRIYEAVTAAFGKLDILVCNASVQIPEPWLEINLEHFHQQVNVNLRSTFELLQLVVPGMKERGWGRILTVGSVQESVPHPDMLVYAATKCAQTSLMRNLAKQLAPDGIILNNLAPGVIGTDRNLGRLADEAYKEVVMGKIPVRRIGEPVDCAGTALLLCSDAAGYLTGQNIYVDGGMSL